MTELDFMSDRFLKPFSLGFNDCPKCHGGIMDFVHDDTKLASEQYTVSCRKCGFSVSDATWRDALHRWNSGNCVSVETVDAVAEDAEDGQV